MTAHLHQQGAGEQLLVIPAVAQDDGPGQLAIAPGQPLLEQHGEGQVVPPSGVLFPPAVRAHHQHHLGDLLPRLLGHHFIYLAVLAH